MYESIFVKILGGCFATQKITYVNTGIILQLHTYFVEGIMEIF